MDQNRFWKAVNDKGMRTCVIQTGNSNVSFAPMEDGSPEVNPIVALDEGRTAVVIDRSEADEDFVYHIDVALVTRVTGIYPRQKDVCEEDEAQA